MKNTLLVITFESVIRDFQLAPKCFNCDSLSYRLVTFDIGSMRWRSKFFMSRSIFQNCQFLSDFAQIVHTYEYATREYPCPKSKQSKWNCGCDACCEPIIIETSDWHQNVSNSTYYHMGRSYLTSQRWRSNIFRSRSFFQNCQFLFDFAQTVHTFVQAPRECPCPI
jgi:hypothetical protein